MRYQINEHLSFPYCFHYVYAFLSYDSLVNQLSEAVGEALEIEACIFAHVRRESDQSACILSYGPTHFPDE